MLILLFDVNGHGVVVMELDTLVGSSVLVIHFVVQLRLLMLRFMVLVLLVVLVVVIVDLQSRAQSKKSQ